MKAFFYPLIASFIICSSSSIASNDNLNFPCDNAEIEKSEVLTPYEFTTIKGILKVDNINDTSYIFYNVDYEYNTKSALYILRYDGDILGDANSWFLNVKEKIYISNVEYLLSKNNVEQIFVDYSDTSGNRCMKRFTLPY